MTTSCALSSPGRERGSEREIHCVLLQVLQFNSFFMDLDRFPPRARPVPATWTPQDEHGDSMPEAEALDEWISTCNQVVPLGGQFTVEEGLVFNRWGMVGRAEEVCALSLFHNPANNR